MGCSQSTEDAGSAGVPQIRIRRDEDRTTGRDSFKVVLLGDKAVGKSSLVLRYTQGRFHDSHALTIGAAFVAKELSVRSSARPTPSRVRLHIWDTAGEEAYRSMTRFFYREAELGICVYDISTGSTFTHVDGWVQDFREQCPDALIVLVGNKSDRENERQVRREEVERYAQSNGFLHIEASAKHNVNVRELFSRVASALYRRSFPAEAAADLKVEE
jgi:small GTP-binding protein